jgi:hypothetical protein
LVPETRFDKVSVLAVESTPVMVVPAGRLLPTISCPTASPTVNDNEVTVLLPPVSAPMKALGPDKVPPEMVRDSSRGLVLVPLDAFDRVSVPAPGLTAVIFVPDRRLGPAIVCPTANPVVLGTKDTVRLPASTVPVIP